MRNRKIHDAAGAAAGGASSFSDLGGSVGAAAAGAAAAGAGAAAAGVAKP